MTKTFKRWLVPTLALLAIIAYQNNIESFLRKRTIGNKLHHFVSRRVLNTEKMRSTLAVIHIGPHKTASTTLQKAFLRDRSFLEKDNFYALSDEEMPGQYKQHKVGANLAHCLRYEHTEIPCDPEFWPRITSTIEYISWKGKNLLLSSEELDQPHVDVSRLKHILAPFDNVRIVAVHRSFYEWLPSVYFELYRPGSMHRSKEEEAYPSLVEWLNEENISEYKYLYTAADRFRDVFDDVVVLNMNDDIVSQFYCLNQLEAPASCQNSLGNKHLKTSNNKGHNLDYDRLVNIAIFRNALPHNVDIAATVGNIEKLGFLVDSPKDCIGGEVRKIMWSVTFHSEKNQYPHLFENPSNSVGIKKLFDHVAKTQLCSINVNAILSDPRLMEQLRAAAVTTD